MPKGTSCAERAETMELYQVSTFSRAWDYSSFPQLLWGIRYSDQSWLDVRVIKVPETTLKLVLICSGVGPYTNTRKARTEYNSLKR
jgi:hypothetical protein